MHKLLRVMDPIGEVRLCFYFGLVAAKNYTEEPKHLIILLRNSKGTPSLHEAY